jgi:hypothetical protein
MLRGCLGDAVNSFLAKVLRRAWYTVGTMESPVSPLPEKKPQQPTAVASPVLHRVCIQCNNMFRVTPDKFDARQCPNCHKG